MTIRSPTMDECEERRDAELEFVASAYSPEESWCEATDDDNNAKEGQHRVHRRLDMPHQDHCIQICLSLTLPSEYPVSAMSAVSATTTSTSPDADNEKKCPHYLQKLALNAPPDLLSTCRQVATESMGAVFLVLNQAEEWIQEEWPRYCKNHHLANNEGSSLQEASSTLDASRSSSQKSQAVVVLGRRLIYSHHIISKIKRGDIRSLASNYKLTGYMKIGWPGLLIIEGREEDCAAFYDEIRPWCWKYLVVRGEQQETIPTGKSLDSERRFQEFLEVDNMSLVAQHCREVGLEALFRTSMKVYANHSDDQSNNTLDKGPNTSWYAALVHVDHMNDGKAYRKWLRRTSQETECLLLIKQCYKHEDYTKRPKIIVGVVGDKGDVSAFLKRWRTSRVDVDSRGKQCLERQMPIISEGALERDPTNEMNWEKTMSEDSVTTSEEQLAESISTIGGPIWSQAFANALVI